MSPSKGNLRSLSCIYRTAGFRQNAKALSRLSLALGTTAEVRAKLKSRLSKEESVSDDVLRLALGMGGFEGELNLSELRRGLKIAGGIGEKALPLLEKGFETGKLELQEQALYSAGGIGEKALPLFKKMLKNQNLDEDIREEIEDTIADLE